MSKLDEPSDRKRPLTEVEIAECEALDALYQSADLGMSQAAFAEKYEIGNQSAVSHFLKKRTALSLKAARGFARGLGVELGAFSPRLAKMANEIAAGVASVSEEFAFVSRARVQVSAGHGAVIYDEGTESALSFRREYLRQQGVSEKNAVVVTVKGSSMEPGISDGAVLLINRAQPTRLVNGLIYAFRLDGELFVKQLFEDKNGIIAKSQNPDREEYPDILIGEKSVDFELIGRAIWMGRKL